MVDANQVWDVDQAIDWMDAPRAVRGRGGSRSRPARTTSSAMPGSPGRSSPSASASRPASTATTGSCSSSSCRPARSASARSTAAGSGGVNEVLAVLLLAAKFGVPVCPARRRRRAVRVRPAPGDLRLHRRQRLTRGPGRRVRRPPARALRRPGVVRDGRYVAPTAPGYSITMHPASLATYAYPDGDGLDARRRLGARADERAARGQGLPHHGRRFRDRPGVGAAVRRRGRAASRSPTSTPRRPPRRSRLDRRGRRRSPRTSAST